jgi:hypothetical protein
LESIGVEVIAGNHTVNQFKNWLIENGKYIDKILLSRPTVAPDYIDYLKKYSSSSLIYYGNDIHYLRIEQQYKITKDNIHLKEIERVRDLEHKIWEDIDTIYYPSVDEENYIRDWCENRKLINKEIRTIPVYAYTNFIINPSDNLEARKGIIFVAGFSHTPNIDAAKWLVNEVLPLVNKNLTNFKISRVLLVPSLSIINDS